ncbi:BZ3500_MvSof-1268-A1-R1_Chr6-1g08377 [Microbotryum saponariae]|uniref:BZ3500_MvSof-1268-A1-R1_Chr6-1g08377 protein n=1 Tax=Microbotryum saponariae TaxID=289078 RepID=A0A2X0LKK4_9BASI|nr:BZ3500_MvSof-1268-A1-R1_Chr6-1g08377 [Microbotryum saponariae]SDA07661.1 BZ3501_MvSof-1269-A2-R1_Chr6-1g08098 [Microbotryum saponariae]
MVGTRSRSCGARIVQGLYGVLVFALLLMGVLEIVRLALSKSGIGLLPFSLAGTLVALGMLAARYKAHKNLKGVAAILVVYWILLTGLQAAKVSALISIEKSTKARGNKGPSKYPNSDKSLDKLITLYLPSTPSSPSTKPGNWFGGRLGRRTADVYEQNGSPQGLGKDGY